MKKNLWEPHRNLIDIGAYMDKTLAYRKPTSSLLSYTAYRPLLDYDDTIRAQRDLSLIP